MLLKQERTGDKRKELEAHMDAGIDRRGCVAWLGQDPFLSIPDPPVHNNFIYNVRHIHYKIQCNFIPHVNLSEITSLQ